METIVDELSNEEELERKSLNQNSNQNDAVMKDTHTTTQVNTATTTMEDDINNNNNN